MLRSLVLMVFLIISLYGSEMEELEKNYPNLSKEVLTDFYEKREYYKTLLSVYDNFDNLSYKKKKIVRKLVNDLAPVDLIFEYTKAEKEKIREFFYLYKSYINLKAYYLIDKFGHLDNALKIGRVLAKLNYDLFPKNTAFIDTYLWGEVKSGNYDLPLKEYPILLSKVSKNEYDSAFVHYNFLLKRVKDRHVKEFIDAIKNKDEKLIKSYVESKKIDLNNDKIMYGFTFLEMVFIAKESDIAKILIANGADVNLQDNKGKTLFHKCSKNNDIECVKLLLENNAEINIKDNEGNTPLYYALQKDAKEVVVFLENNGATNDKKVVKKKEENFLISLLVQMSNIMKGKHIDDIVRFDIAKAKYNGIELNYTIIGKDGNNSLIPEQILIYKDVGKLNPELEKEVKKVINELRDLVREEFTDVFCDNKLFKKMKDEKIHYEVIYNLYDKSEIFRYKIYPSTCRKVK